LVSDDNNDKRGYVNGKDIYMFAEYPDKSQQDVILGTLIANA